MANRAGSLVFSGASDDSNLGKGLEFRQGEAVAATGVENSENTADSQSQEVSNKQSSQDASHSVSSRSRTRIRGSRTRVGRDRSRGQSLPEGQSLSSEDSQAIASSLSQLAQTDSAASRRGNHGASTESVVSKDSKEVTASEKTVRPLFSQGSPVFSQDTSSHVSLTENLATHSSPFFARVKEEKSPSHILFTGLQDKSDQSVIAPTFSADSVSALLFQEPDTSLMTPASHEEEYEGEGESDSFEYSRTRRRRERPTRSREAFVQAEEDSAHDSRDIDTHKGSREENISEEEEISTGVISRRRRRRRQSDIADEVSAPRGSTRLEAKRQRRREGREAGKRRHTITEAEYLARREAVNRKMLIREKDGLNQIAVLEDGILVEHYVARHTQKSMVGNVYLGRVQNVLPSMEAAFVDIGKGRNAVLYAGEVNWDAAGLEGKPRKIEEALSSGDTVMVQVTKDPIGHKGARLTAQITLAGRHLVLVPHGEMTGISRKLPERERLRLKKLLRDIVPAEHGVIVRTAAEGASEEQLRADVERLSHSWQEIQKKAKSGAHAPVLLKGEPELAVRVVRDIFNEDFESLQIQGENAWKTISEYVEELTPELSSRVSRWVKNDDIFTVHRVEEQLAKAFDRKVWLPSGGTLVIDRTEAMTVIDVNTGKFTGTGGTLEETVTRNNLEAAEEIVRQLRLRDIGGIIVVDFIDMVLEANRELVLRRLVECLGRDRTRHQVAEVTSLGLVQMTRKRVGQGLVEAFSTVCEECEGRGYITHTHPVEKDENNNEVHTSHSRSSKDEASASEEETKRENTKNAMQSIAAASSDSRAESSQAKSRERGKKRGRIKHSEDDASQSKTSTQESSLHDEQSSAQVSSGENVASPQSHEDEQSVARENPRSVRTRGMIVAATPVVVTTKVEEASVQVRGPRAAKTDIHETPQKSEQGHDGKGSVRQARTITSSGTITPGLS